MQCSRVIRAVGGLAGQRCLSTAASDKVFLKGLLFHGHHGVYEEERKLGQKFRMDVVLDTDLRKAGRTDDLQHTINYAAVYREIEKVVTGTPCQLLERVAERVAAQIMTTEPLVSAVRIEILKPHVAVSGVVEGLGISIHRTRDEMHTAGII